MKKQLLAAGFVVLSVMLPLKAMAANFTSLNVLGDSLSDTGNILAVTGGLVPSPTAISGQSAYFSGRFSNGPNWVDYFGEQQGLTPTPFLLTQADPTIPTQEGVNFAFGGATTGGITSVSAGGTELPIPGIETQLGFLQANFEIDPTGLYTFLGGNNDYFSTSPASVADVVDNLSSTMENLIQAGAQNFLAFTLPDLSKTPVGRSPLFTPEERQFLRDTIIAHNQQLELELDSLRSLYPQVNFFLADIASVVDEIRESPAEFGFQDVVNSCINGDSFLVNSVCENPNDFLFFDNIHYSSKAHQLFAKEVLEVTHVPEPSVTLGLLALGALSAVGAVKRKQKLSPSFFPLPANK